MKLDRQPRSLVDLVRDRAQQHPQRGYRFLGDGVTTSERLTYGDLDRAARSIAGLMQANGVQKGARALLLYPPGLEFVRAFWACFYAGAIAVPVPAPHTAKAARLSARLHAIVNDAAASVVLTTSRLESTARSLLATAPQLASTTLLATDGAPVDADAWRPDEPFEPIAVLQYTSGSTRDPRGVVVSHQNLLSNLALLRRFHLEQERMVMVSWLPVYHDMGLIRGMMSPLHMGGDCVMMPPLEFVQRPFKWLKAITTYGGTTTGAPNFGFELALRRIPDEQRALLDLSTLAVAFCTAEPIRKRTIDRFVDRFAECGFRRGAFRPAYGLAESTVAVAGELGDGPRTFRVDGSLLRQGRIVPTTSEQGCDFVSCGPPLGDTEVLIVDEAGARCPPDRIGEVWVRGPSVARGYWKRPTETAETFGAHLADGSGPFLRTGDLGCFTPDGGLCITGRKKDLMIVRGVNHQPHDVELTLESALPALRPGCSAAFTLENEDGGAAVVILAEYDSRREDDPAPWAAMVVTALGAIGSEHELALHALCFVAPGQIPKTPSGKVQRSLASQMYRDGAFDALYLWVAPARAADEPGRGRAIKDD